MSAEKPPYRTVVPTRELLALAHRWDEYEPRDLSHHSQGVVDGFSMAADMLRRFTTPKEGTT